MRLFGLEIGRAQAPAPRVEPPVTACASASGEAGLLAVGWGSLGPSAVRGLPRVTPETAVHHGTVFACCNNIAGDLAKVPLKLWQRGSDGQDTRVRDHPAAYLLNGEAAPGVPARLVRFAAVYGYALRGNGHIYGPRDGGGELTRLDIVRQSSVTLLRDGLERFYQFEDGAGVQRRVPARSMVHLRYMAEDGWTGRSPLQVAAESVGIALAGQRAAARNAAGGTTKGVIKLGENYEDDDQRARNARRIKAAMQDPGSDGWIAVNPDEDVKALDISAADQELLSSRKFDREMIAGIYRMPPSKLQMLEYGVKANGEQQAIDYLTDCLLHWSALVEAQLDVALLTRAEREAGLFLRHDFGALLQPTVKEQYDALSRAVGGPFLRPNEARAKLGAAPVPEGARLNPAPNMTRTDPAESEGDPE
ncbi:phage portal protein [Salipiger marinus]|uniref:Phage portal protein, HK97 family n=1 Tax=Salipiger marinus TaxID=555512 RepID=A0A1G8RXJ4_9RHOB|nr:phage portal protein [Salipiger marinus]SDJ21679.1 phage portal protein, HK97 family [Salipiger marinus]